MNDINVCLRFFVAGVPGACRSAREMGAAGCLDQAKIPVNSRGIRNDERQQLNTE
jgi:hypothetical protein